MPGPFGTGGVPISGYAMLQHQIKAVHESAHQEEKQRQDHGKKVKLASFNAHISCCLLSALSSLFSAAAAANSELFIAYILGPIHFYAVS